ncbi:unnamed protein product [Orchesella dallaii]|uniref:Golgi to ER traffic protein 4 n=1 Tax=Orchesella dallaii TaxID=48710 RepID=A0ABP1S9I3_9HEXA
MSDRQATGSSRLLTKLHEAVKEKKFYEAHQLLKTLSFRYTTTKKYDELEELLVKYSGFLLDHKQYESGMDVAIMLSKLYATAEFPVTEKRISDSVSLLQKMPNSPERLNFISGVVEWARDSELVGEVHAAATKLYITDRDFGDAWRHIMRINDGEQAATLTLQIMTLMKGYLRLSEVDLVIGHLVIAFLVGKRVAHAESAFMKLVKECPIQDRPPLFNGLRYLIEAAKTNDAQAFKAVRDLYEPSFCRDPMLRKLVANAGKSLFNLPDSRVDRQSGGGLMPMLLNAFLNPAE